MKVPQGSAPALFPKNLFLAKKEKKKKQNIPRPGGGGGGRRGLGPRNDLRTTCKAVTLRGGQRIVALFPTVNIFRLFRSKKRTGRGNQKYLKN